MPAEMAEATQAANVREDLRLAGPVSVKEAHEILSRFIASHFRKTNRERARFTIPANSKRDDDIRMSAFIEQHAAAEARVLKLETAIIRVHTELKRLVEKEGSVPAPLFVAVEDAAKLVL